MGNEMFCGFHCPCSVKNVWFHWIQVSWGMWVGFWVFFFCLNSFSKYFVYIIMPCFSAGVAKWVRVGTRAGKKREDTSLNIILKVGSLQGRRWTITGSNSRKIFTWCSKVQRSEYRKDISDGFPLFAWIFVLWGGITTAAGFIFLKETNIQIHLYRGRNHKADKMNIIIRKKELWLLVHLFSWIFEYRWKEFVICFYSFITWATSSTNSYKITVLSLETVHKPLSVS